MHVKLAESNGHQEFDLAERLNRQRADIEGRMKASGADDQLDRRDHVASTR